MDRLATRWKRLLAIAATVLLVGSCTTADSEPEPAPDPDPDPTPEPAEDEPDEPDEELDELEQELAEIAEQVSIVRELPLLDEIDTEVVGPDELAAIVSDRGTDAEALDRVAAAERVLIALRHLPEEADLLEIQEELLTAAVVGLYDPESATAYVSSEATPLGPAAASTAAHELLHALQDQHFDLTRLDDFADEDGDAVLAYMSVVEGDAVILEEEWSASYQTEEEREQAEQEQVADAEGQLEQLQDAPAYVVESFIFPYVAGELFVTTLINEGGYEAVNDALEDPPTTTLEVLDPDQYLAGDFEPTDVQAGAAPGEDWEPLFTSSFGVFDLLALFGSSAAPEAAQGATAWPAWRGGALEAWERDGEVTVAAAWTFEDADRAAVVCDALPGWYEDRAEAEEEGGGVWRGDRDMLAVSCDAADVRFAIGPDGGAVQATLDVD